MNSQTRQNITVLTIIVVSVIGGSFLYLSSKEKHFESSDCVLLRTYSHYYGIFCFTIAALLMLVHIYYYRLFLFASVALKDKSCMIGVDQIQLISGIIGIIFTFLIAYALYLHEPCGNLRKFTILYFIFAMILYCLQCFGMCTGLGILEK
ncbi:unnamed protein product (macronuclear) [Paramecium tetraurelia]|uniref:Uncharacterized protein n=1 Tax=Paramecium tetraurelia TaxID=5888 RepID=A0BCG8_PARTE|nr:uncharacterized protein GSPATT00004329001 [Paramecium tetraurelia]CAK56235.1 unnamed protein product [Paramecium tetraurelia]|eukprot:XP_001423633.1 hypothetical protein (macronuclear) [Paramecium tetraurelia strain d4-2]